MSFRIWLQIIFHNSIGTPKLFLLMHNRKVYKLICAFLYLAIVCEKSDRHRKLTQTYATDLTAFSKNIDKYQTGK